jgi:hypothetical protein
VEQCSFLPPVVPCFGTYAEQFVEPDFLGYGEVDEIWRDLTRSDPMLFEVQAPSACMSFALASEPQLASPGLQMEPALTPPWAGSAGDGLNLAAHLLDVGPDLDPRTLTYPPGFEPMIYFGPALSDVGLLTPQPEHADSALAVAAPASIDGVTNKFQQLEVDGATTFMAQVFGLLPASLMGPQPPALPVPVPVVPPPPPRRASARLAKAGKQGLTQEQKAQARLAKQLQFIDSPNDFSPAVRAAYVGRFKEPLGKELSAMLGRATGASVGAIIDLPDDQLLELAGGEVAA